MILGVTDMINNKQNPLYFWNDYQESMDLGYFEFAGILIAGEVGCIVAIVFNGLNAHYLKTDQNIMIVYQCVAGISCLFYPLYWFIYGNSNGSTGVIVWCCVFRFLLGISFAFETATTVKFATSFTTDESEISKIIAIMHYSWPLATILNVFAGYVIEYQSWMMVYIYAGIILICGSVALAVALHLSPLKEIAIDADNAGRHSREMEEVQLDPMNIDKIKGLITDFNSTLICFVSFIMTFRNRTISIVTGSLWMEDTYGLSSSGTGWSTLSAIVGESLALAFAHWFSHMWDIQILAGGTLVNQLCVGALLLILSGIFGNYLTLPGALVLEAMLTFGVELFYVVQQTNIMFFAPKGLRTSLLLLERGSQECGTIIAILITATIWDELYSNGILAFSVVWILATGLQSLILYLYERERTWEKPVLE